jgi:hypothetical protein
MLHSSRRGFGVVVVTGLGLVALGASGSAGCSDTAADTTDGGGFDDAGGDAAKTDGATTDGAVVDGSGGGDGDGGLDSGDAAATCSALGGTYAKTCTTVADCTTVARGCHCGQQPVIGIAKSASATASACETLAQITCKLGCPSAAGQVAEDGNSDVDGGTIEVRCDANVCHTVVP